ncbi:beta-lactamase-like protein [Lophiotrema nucula]|uniref:Beta-lactamase-like protein n=1 Tax=Lophiotrema nucula TaxID=690887 RepID=A0A6A5YX52_9PLEO|nr:beta-lactamase-like protein [Lophiotrema nucula]
MSAPALVAEAAEIPKVEIPPSSNTVTVRVIDTTTRIRMPVGTMFDPPIKGHTRLASPSYSFLIENEHLGGKVLFDLGTQKLWKEQAPGVVSMIEEFEWDVTVEKDVADILQEHGVPLAAIDAIVWSHSHWDHLGDPSTFPTSCDIVVGPGFLEDCFPDGLEQPEPDCWIKREYYENRKIREIKAEQFQLDIAGFPAFDYFGDGSFYLLNSPGHAIGHISALARTTSNPDTFIFMGGDIANHPAEFRPSQLVPLPALISPNPLHHSSSTPCPGHIFDKIHREGRCNSPFYCIGTWPDGSLTVEDLSTALESHGKLRLVDAQCAQVFVILAHDENVGDVIDFFPKSVNAWKKLGWADRARWMFLGDFKEAVSDYSTEASDTSR